MAAKETITVTLDPELVQYAKHHARSFSVYVNEALAAKVHEDRRRRALLQAHRDRAHEGADHALVDRRMAHVAQQIAALTGEAQ
ncbi:type II toxin-antitoxin system CcdA family antitoxin [Nonomuraea sp. KM90]|uniref:type II toxin-antitoxin system CcdA family antitoxin n=1 Tax=Nonomuraea sp. KM90 TaxID=3457428 RepID=UPI003FCCE880